MTEANPKRTASAVCRKAAGSRPHPATISHMGIHFQPLSAICGSTLSHMWFHMPVDVVDLMAFNVEGGN